MAIFNSYVSLPEGSIESPKDLDDDWIILINLGESTVHNPYAPCIVYGLVMLMCIFQHHRLHMCRDKDPQISKDDYWQWWD